MGRTKKFCREEVLERAVPVFWEHGYADTSLQDLEKATRVNKSGLYGEFEDKEDLFLASLRHYLVNSQSKVILATEPLGWDNIRRFLKRGQKREDGQIGCFAVYSMRELSVLPPKALEILKDNRVVLKRLIVANIEAESPELDSSAVAAQIQTFFTGLCLEQNIDPFEEASADKVEDFLNLIRPPMATQTPRPNNHSGS